MPRKHTTITPWTGPELVKLRALFPCAPWEEIAAALPRHGLSAIRSQAGRLRISRPRTDHHAEDRHPLIAELIARQKALGLSSAKVADEAGVERTSMLRMRNQLGHRLPTGRVLEAWASALGLDLAFVERRQDCSVTAAVQHNNANLS